jgi:homoserine O-acetyltransferase
MEAHDFLIEKGIKTEEGDLIAPLNIRYHTAGELNEDKSNVLWVFHAFSGNSDVSDWWSNLYGEGSIFDPSKYFIVCANILGSCYGTSGANDVKDFPFITIRDMVECHKLLANHLGIDKIHIGIGPSMGGYQLMEWELAEPSRFENAIYLATSIRESEWGRAIHTAQRMALENDLLNPKYKDKPGYAGVEVARALGMVSYRSYDCYKELQIDSNPKVREHKVRSYIEYQAKKMADRFSAKCYLSLLDAMDSHDIRRGRPDWRAQMQKSYTKHLSVGIRSDVLCPSSEQKLIAESFAFAQFYEIDSFYGHDGFLTEGRKIKTIIEAFLSAS